MPPMLPSSSRRWANRVRHHQYRKPRLVAALVEYIPPLPANTSVAAASSSPSVVVTVIAGGRGSTSGGGGDGGFGSGSADVWRRGGCYSQRSSTVESGGRDLGWDKRRGISRVDLPSGSSVGISFSFRPASGMDVQGTPTLRLASSSKSNTCPFSLPLFSLILLLPSRFHSSSKRPGCSGAATSVVNTNMHLPAHVHKTSTTPPNKQKKKKKQKPPRRHTSALPLPNPPSPPPPDVDPRPPAITVTTTEGLTQADRATHVTMTMRRRRRCWQGGGGCTPPTRPRASVYDIGGGVLYSPSASTTTVASAACNYT
ncbi:hypothetical protein H4582DRAFT_2125871 [Lactarius indigo]|nr:hypothetical protein H4582DRAFT_2125871 [Lactarius indigo]